MAAILPDLGKLDAPARKAMLKLLLGAMLDGLAVGTEALDLTELDFVAQKSRNLLRSPWAIDSKEMPRSRTAMFLQAPGKDRVGLREEQTIIRAGHNSRIGRLINRKSVIGTKLGKSDYLRVMTALMELLSQEGWCLASTSRLTNKVGVCHLQLFASFLAKPFEKRQLRETYIFMIFTMRSLKI